MSRREEAEAHIARSYSEAIAAESRLYEAPMLGTPEQRAAAAVLTDFCREALAMAPECADGLDAHRGRLRRIAEGELI